MPLIIGDEILQEANLTESDARVEIACRLYAAGRLSFVSAVRLSGLSSDRFRDALATRSIGSDGPEQQILDQQYAEGYARFPENSAEFAALVPHLPVQSEPWE
jgi:predicted HTH domain antitoxin